MRLLISTTRGLLLARQCILLLALKLSKDGNNGYADDVDLLIKGMNNMNKMRLR